MGEATAAEVKLLSLDDVSAEIETVEKRIESEIETLKLNAARVGDDETAFGAAADHRKKLEAIVQSVDDLTRRREVLRRLRSAANSVVNVELPGDVVVSIHEALDMERRSIKWRHAARMALDSGWKHANSDRSMRANPQPVIRLFDEAKRLKQLDKLSELNARIKPAIRRGNRAQFIELKDDGSFTLHVDKLDPTY